MSTLETPRLHVRQRRGLEIWNYCQLVCLLDSLLVDTGSSNTWVDGETFKKTSTSVQTPNKVVS